MFSLFKKKNPEIEGIYHQILGAARAPRLYDEFAVPDKPIGRFQMIALHAAPILKTWSAAGQYEEEQILFDLIFQDIEYSFREIGVGDLSVPKKMKAYMKDFNGIIQAHLTEGADHVDITRRNVFGEDGNISAPFKTYIKDLFA